jgi:hypothetical protein
MAGRGDNNKSGSAGRGSSNQSNQGFITSGSKQHKSDRAKKTSGNAPSESSPRTADADANRNEPLKEEKRKRR